jgi:uncharacterized protein
MKKDFPNKIPIFPLTGVIFFPKTNLPLNIFEKRYLDLVDDCMKTNKLMGMVQSKKNVNDVYSVGCLGKISDFKKADDGRVLINLTGLTRFEIKDEINTSNLYRVFNVKYDKFSQDLNESENYLKEREINHLFEKSKNFFKKNGLLLNWLEFNKLDHNQQVNTLAMIAPISSEEKQKLLETLTINEKSKILSEIIEFYLHDKISSRITIQ